MILTDFLKKAAVLKTSLSFPHHLHRQMVRVVCVVRKTVVTLFLITTNKEMDMVKERKATEVQEYVVTTQKNTSYIFTLSGPPW